MIYTPLTKKAMRIAFDVHRDQVDKSGAPYIYHPIHLAEQMTDEATTCVALLHDTIEDGDVTAQFLREQGFTEEIITAITLMTHAEGVPYLDYVALIKANRVASTVKLADLRHNSDVTRLDRVDEKVAKRLEKYARAIALLSE